MTQRQQKQELFIQCFLSFIYRPLLVSEVVDIDEISISFMKILKCCVPLSMFWHLHWYYKGSGGQHAILLVLTMAKDPNYFCNHIDLGLIFKNILQEVEKVFIYLKLDHRVLILRFSVSVINQEVLKNTFNIKHDNHPEFRQLFDQ